MVGTNHSFHYLDKMTNWFVRYCAWELLIACKGHKKVFVATATVIIHHSETNMLKNELYEWSCWNATDRSVIHDMWHCQMFLSIKADFQVQLNAQRYIIKCWDYEWYSCICASAYRIWTTNVLVKGLHKHCQRFLSELCSRTSWHQWFNRCHVVFINDKCKSLGSANEKQPDHSSCVLSYLPSYLMPHTSEIWMNRIYAGKVIMDKL